MDRISNSCTVTWGGVLFYRENEVNLTGIALIHKVLGHFKEERRRERNGIIREFIHFSDTQTYCSCMWL